MPDMTPDYETLALKAAYYDCMVQREQIERRMEQINARLRELAARPRDNGPPNPAVQVEDIIKLRETVREADANS